MFPVFGKSKNHVTSTLPQHGFARVSKWRCLKKIEGDESTSSSIQLGLSHNDLSSEFAMQWPYQFELVYTIKVEPTQLSTRLLVRNLGKESFDYNVLLHTYFSVGDIDAVSVEGLSGLTYADKVKSASAQQIGPVHITGETDRVYKYVQEPTITVLEKKKPVHVIKRDNMKDIVVWNPWDDHLPADFAPSDGYKHMLCVEAGCVSQYEVLQPGTSSEYGQTISIG